VISRDLSETLPQAERFVNGTACPSFTSSPPWLVPVNKSRLPLPPCGSRWAERIESDAPHDLEGIADYKMVFYLERRRLNGFLGI
jgi:hypothetical protein